MPKQPLILLVDDDRMDVELILDGFQEAKLVGGVQVASSGQAALDYLFGAGPYADRDLHPLPDLVLLDLKMPGVDGFEVLRRVKSTPGLKRLPIVILTSSREDSDRTATYDGGANSYLVKPTSLDGFLGTVRRIEEYWLAFNVGPPEVDAV
jgi:CheY-like chemotaxis protein